MTKGCQANFEKKWKEADAKKNGKRLMLKKWEEADVEKVA